MTGLNDVDMYVGTETSLFQHNIVGMKTFSKDGKNSIRPQNSTFKIIIIMLEARACHLLFKMHTHMCDEPCRKLIFIIR
jgi:hypothetical protein